MIRCMQMLSAIEDFYIGRLKHTIPVTIPESMSIRIDTGYQHVLKQEFRELVTLFHRHDVRFWPQSGTLLGMYTHQDIIPWDDDIDIGILSEDKERALSLLDAQGYTVEKRSELFYKITSRNVFIDIFIWKLETDRYVDRQNHEFFLRNELFPLTDETYKYGDAGLSIPNGSLAYLNRFYRDFETYGVIRLPPNGRKLIKSYSSVYQRLGLYDIFYNSFFRIRIKRRDPVGLLPSSYAGANVDKSP